MLTEKQRGVLGGMLTGLVLSLAALGLSIGMLSPAGPPEQELATAIGRALRWDVLLALCLTVNIGLLAKHRFFTPADIDGGGLSEGTSTAKVLQSILQNTLEQTLLALMAHSIWAASMPWSWQDAVPAAAVLFFVGRVLFWRGYAHGAPARALGFALTFYPSVILLATIVARLAWRTVTAPLV